MKKHLALFPISAPEMSKKLLTMYASRTEIPGSFLKYKNGFMPSKRLLLEASSQMSVKY